MTGNAHRYPGTHLPLLVLLGSMLGISGCNETTAATMRADSSQANPQLQLLGRVNSLESELSKLQNTVEVQENELTRLRERLSGVYDDLDGRLRSVEISGVGGSMPPVAPADGVSTDREIPSIPQSSSSMAKPISPAMPVAAQKSEAPAPAATERAVESPVQTATTEVSALEQQSYDRAFELLKQSRYEESVAAFKEFQTRFPRSSLADSAQYWVAEARYVNRAYDAALHEYNTLIQRYPESKRLPDAMLKVGYIHFDNEQWTQARRALNAVVIRYPGSRVAVSAKMRLDQMCKSGH